MYVQSFNTFEAKLSGGVRDTKFLVFCRQTYTRMDTQADSTIPLKTVYSQFAHSHFAQIFPFRPFVFRPFQLRPFPIPPNICPALLPFRPISFSPIFHFARKPSRRTFPFRPITVLPFSHKAPSHFAQIPFFLISGPKTNKRFSNNLIPQF